MGRDDSYDFDDEGLEPRRRDGLFLWTVFILLLIGAVCACWMGSFYVFGHPEEPRSYKILKKLKKIEPPRRFDVTAAPLGDFISPQKAYERYSSQKSLQLQNENAELLRIYIKNYTETKKLVPYLRGKFEVIETRELTSADLFPSGTVALLQAQDYPQVVVEHIFPATGSNLDVSKRLLAPGFPFSIEKTNDVTAILHIDRLADGRMLLTVVPLHYPSYALKGGAGTFNSEPPMDLHIEAGLPIWKRDLLDQAIKRYAQTKANVAPVDDTAKQTPQGPEVVRLDNLAIGQKVPETGALPEPTVARAEPVRPVAPTPRQRPSTELALNNTRPAQPAATPLPPGVTPGPVTRPQIPVVQVPTPAPLPPVATPRIATGPTGTTPTGVPLKPFVQSNPGVVPQAESGASWRMYPAGQLPQGRSVTAGEAASLADQPSAGERVYLRGEFFVSAMGDNKAVLRPRGEGAPTTGAIRVIAEFPSGSLPPTEGSTFSRDASRAFQVISVNRASDGQVNVFVREVTR